MAKTSLKEIKHKRDGGGGAILPIPHCVLNSQAYIDLSPRAVKLLFDIAMQYNVHNNGSLLASWRHMSEKRGWSSMDALLKAKLELIEHQLIVETVRGKRPNLAGWYAITWAALDQIKGLEITAQDFPRGSYARWIAPEVTKAKRLPPPPESREKHYAKLREEKIVYP